MPSIFKYKPLDGPCGISDTSTVHDLHCGFYNNIQNRIFIIWGENSKKSSTHPGLTS